MTAKTFGKVMPAASAQHLVGLTYPDVQGNAVTVLDVAGGRALLERGGQTWGCEAKHLGRLYLCERYRAELARLYGQGCAEASTVEPDGKGRYLVSIAESKGDGFEAMSEPQPCTQAQMERMIANLSKRRVQA